MLSAIGRVSTTTSSPAVPTLFSNNQQSSYLCPYFPHTMHLSLFVAFVLLVPALPFAMAVSNSDLMCSPFFGRPGLLPAVQSGHKHNMKSGSCPTFKDFIVMLASEYRSNGNCSRHCFLFLHIGMTLIGSPNSVQLQPCAHTATHWSCRLCKCMFQNAIH